MNDVIRPPLNITNIILIILHPTYPAGIMKQRHPPRNSVTKTNEKNQTKKIELSNEPINEMDTR